MNPRSLRAALLLGMVLVLGACRGSATPAGPPPILQFRILAHPARDEKAAEEARRGTIDKPPSGFSWLPASIVYEGKSLEPGDKILTAPKAAWKPGRFEGFEVEVRGKNLADSPLARTFAISGNTGDTLRLEQSPQPFFSAIDSYRIRSGRADLLPMDAVQRTELDLDGTVRTYVLARLDREDLTEKDVASAYATSNDRSEPAVGVAFTEAGARKLSTLTRANLPEQGGARRYYMAIIVDGQVVTSPGIMSEIAERAIIENMNPAEVDRLLVRLRHATEKPKR